MPPSETFMRNNQNYRQAGDWRFDRDSRYTGDGYRRSDGQKKIMGYSQKQGGRRMGEPSTQPSSLNEFFYRSRRLLAKAVEDALPSTGGARVH
jgi:hypothetical protein